MENFFRDLKHIRFLNKETKIKIGFFLTVLLVLGFILGTLVITPQFLMPEPLPAPPSPESAQPVEPTARPSISLNLQPDNKTVKVGETIDVSVIISGEPADAVDIILKYDPKVFTAMNIKQGTIFPVYLVKKIEKGKITVSSSLDPENKNIQSNLGEVFMVELKAIAPTSSTQISFDPDETTAAKNGENILGISVNGNYIVVK